MTRFRKGTTDHDNDGKQGGSLKAGTRFVPGTNDHDGDGRKGGSLKGDDTMAKKATGVAKGGKLNVQSGQEGSEKPAKAAVKAKQAETAAQFAEADAKAQPTQSEEDRIAEIQAGIGVRGY